MYSRDGFRNHEYKNNREQIACKIWASHSCMTKDSHSLECYAVSTGEWLPAFRQITVPQGQTRTAGLDLEGKNTAMLKNVSNYLAVDLL
jgi:hypothetical protein